MATTGSPLRVYTLNDLPAEVVAVTFAKTSRVPDSFDDIARELSETDSSRFHEKWVIGYGHSSVAEHAVLSIAIENVSILGAKVVEENRLSSFTERSTRYQAMSPGNYYTPPCFEENEAYRRCMAALYETYAKLRTEAEAFCERKYGGAACREAGVGTYGKACDAVRGLLPAATKTNLGWTVNARSLRHAIVKMASHPLSEMRELARTVEGACRVRVPTLLKHTEESPYLSGWSRRIRECVDSVERRGETPRALEPGVRLVSHDPDGERKTLAAVLFRTGGGSYEAAGKAVSDMSENRVGVLLREALRGIGSHEAPVREFESTAYTFEVVCDFGAYRDIQRHRMSTQTQQPLSCELGYSIPTDAREAGLGPRTEDALEAARETWAVLAEADPVHAQYAVPLAFHKRFLIHMNYREAYQLVRLRSRAQGHESYRRVAWAIKEEIERVHPALGDLIPAEYEDASAEAVAEEA
jgi:thymidylate synthase ThyX